MTTETEIKTQGPVEAGEYPWHLNMFYKCQRIFSTFRYRVRETIAFWFLDLAFWIKGVNNGGYVGHAVREYKLISATPEREVMDLIRCHAMHGHSGGSHFATLHIFNHLINGKTLSPITDNPAEWVDMSRYQNGEPIWQNIRNSALFSEDHGKTYTDANDPATDEKGTRMKYTSVDHTKPGVENVSASNSAT